ncbi:hypothetical protein [Streptomyces rhizosphaericus]|uniref:SDR family oxidoreductase n=1 Tax=Streptomyces rhizosphaericus TaxID=114699 RepID=A0A6G4AHX1_9ACTN|nr:hypothetical protein [Streptomyces rhizosphaericus]NEW72943.1 hypothetical protein [Streptomyces rhizosphaericus]
MNDSDAITIPAASTGGWIIGAPEAASVLASLLGRGVGTASSLEHTQGPVRRLCLVPAMPEPCAFQDSSAEHLHTSIGGTLTLLMTELRQAARAMGGNPEGGRIVVLLPEKPSMGAADGFPAAAVCGAAVSMLRTLAMELERRNISVNTLFYSGDLSASANTKALTALLDTLLFGDTAPVIGQEVFVAGGADLGRLHP